DTCTVVSTTARICAGLSVTLPGGNANQTPDFTGAAVASSGQQVRVTVTRSGISCSADFTFMTAPGGGGWGEPDGGNHVGGQGGDTSTAGAGGEGMTTSAGG